jgi:hypothetical protein
MSKDLLTPRFIVKANYPGSKLRIGHIIEGKSDLIYFDLRGERYSPRYSDYPHLFEPIPWWSHREESELPQYIRFYEPLPEKYRIGKVEKWEVNKERAIVKTDANILRRELSVSDLPATLEDYQNYLKLKEK